MFIIVVVDCVVLVFLISTISHRFNSKTLLLEKYVKRNCEHKHLLTSHNDESYFNAKDRRQQIYLGCLAWQHLMLQLSAS